MVAVTFSADLLFKGAVNGLIISIVAMGIVLVYRSSRVINFAVGDLGVPATALLGVMAGVHKWPYGLALIAALAVGAGSGALVELAIVRRLAQAPRVIVLVATIGVAQLAQAITRTIPSYKKGSLGASAFPVPIHGSWELPGNIELTGPQLFVIVVVPVVAIAMWWLLARTTFGHAVQATATNADLARMTGISPKLTASGVWTVAGTLSALGIILTATVTPSTDIVQIGPDTLLKAFAAALIGRMTSFPLAAIGAVGLGALEQFFRQNVEIQDPSRAGITKFALLVLVLVLVARTSRRTESGGESFQFTPRVRPVPERLLHIWWARSLPKIAALVGLSIAALAPLLAPASSKHLAWAVILATALCAVSIVVLTGWGGQLSLGQMAFAGIGALTAAALERGLRFELAIFDTQIIKAALQPFPFWLSVLIGGVVATMFAGIVGISALRVRGLLLGVSTLAFAVACQNYIFRRPILAPDLTTTVPFRRQAIGPLDITHRNRAYYYLVLAVVAIVLVVVGRLRTTGIGRSIIGVRENEHAASALTVSPVRAKLIAFLLGGFIAGIGGALLAGVVESVSFANQFFTVSDSLVLISLVVIGGLTSLSGAVVGALWVVGLPTFFPGNRTVPLFTSSIGLLIVLLYLPGGFSQIGLWLRDLLFGWVERRLPPTTSASAVTVPSIVSTPRARDLPTVADDAAVLSVERLSVRFGGNVAVDCVDLTLGQREVVGLIGTNGAGKSTLLNAIGGYSRASGSVHIMGVDATALPAHRRARLGLGRTFQAATLFPELTVRETVELGLEARRTTPFWPALLSTPGSIRLSRSQRAQASELIDFLGLGRYGDRFIAELSTGTRRIVELAAMLAAGPKVICLDEPTAGVAQREAEAFGPLIVRVQQELDASLIIVEHDLPLIMSISDRVYCLEAGRVIAQGCPDEVRNDPAVVMSYLGTDERAIRRSNAERTE